MNKVKQNNYPTRFNECFSFDESEFNPTPKSWLGKLWRIRYVSRYSSTTWMRLSQYFCIKSQCRSKIKRVMYGNLSQYYRRKNETLNGLSCALNPQIKPGIKFHHRNVIITEETIIEEGVHIYGNVTFGSKNGCAPIVKKNAKIAGNSMIIGKVTVGEGAIIAPGAIVLIDVPPQKIAAGVPAKIVGDVTDDNYDF